MTSVPLRLLTFAIVLVLAGAIAAAVGAAVGDEVEGAADDEPAHGADPHDAGDAPAHDDRAAGAAETAPPGLAVAQDGLRLVPDATVGRRGTQRYAFRVVDADGRPVRRFDVAHERRMHLVVVRRDLAGFQHLHPRLGSDGRWSTRLHLAAPGTYRVFADFTIAGKQRTLATDLHVPGDFRPAAVPPPAVRSVDDRGATVLLRRNGDRVAFRVLRAGRDVTERLEPYLGARGHLVALREGDLAYLHSHPEEDRPAFAVELPTAGRYRLWLQYRLDGVVRTAAFTQEVAR